MSILIFLMIGSLIVYIICLGFFIYDLLLLSCEYPNPHGHRDAKKFFYRSSLNLFIFGLLLSFELFFIFGLSIITLIFIIINLIFSSFGLISMFFP